MFFEKFSCNLGLRYLRENRSSWLNPVKDIAASYFKVHDLKVIFSESCIMAIVPRRGRLGWKNFNSEYISGPSVLEV